jgi:AraC-like DNA-binding protein
VAEGPATAGGVAAAAQPPAAPTLARFRHDLKAPLAATQAAAPAGELEERALGRVEIVRYVGDGQWHCESDDRCRLIFQGAGRSVIGTGNGSPLLALSAAEWIVLTEPALELRGWWSSEIVSIALPRQCLSRPLLRQVQRGRPAVMAMSGAARLCLDLARLCLAQRDGHSDAVGAALGDALTDLVKLALIEQSSATRSETIRETVRARILGHVNRNLADPELTIERIADHMHCTKRYLHKVFSENGETLSQYIWSRRLELCRARLVLPELGARSITEIAFACGFSNAAHFSRSFKARFGQSPRAFRRAELA